ncbi:polysaccharide biosynthesis tyrosine autokinase [Nonomuraea cavernae]|uniref:non-specific protein-tyrosine kinase n=1 Tax=Nonomuraea cavernae TaxID=2045107 RepID=A0A917YTA5_9ACTN|nr:polysaccharide biosynthesis tyrosine autokinase [Nonomuraea cavernae]MCA2185164.1 polysaccharide biosynthesis tyrosine autokinase [Nonomuraea cavernae]GGO65605.1 chromosome partitioning protein [Nonomuraea cavernae]
MDLLSLVRLARKNWMLIFLSLIISVGAALVVTANMPPKYVATITMLFSSYDKQGAFSPAYQVGTLSQGVQSYATLLTSRRLVSEIATGDEIPRLQARITAEVVPGTVLLRAMVSDADPNRAAALANALGAKFAKLIDQIERPTPTSRPTVKVTVVDQAEVPQKPVSPVPLLNLLIAVLVALVASISALILRERLDTTIKTSDVLQRTSESSTLGIIGYERDARRHPLIVRRDGRSSRAEAFRSLRTNLQFIGVDRQPKSLVITSCLPNEGKSSTSSNLAITLAQTGWRVLLVDGDLRRPRIPDYLGIEGGIGLTDVLIGRARLADVIQTWGEPSLHVLPSGQTPPNPSELLGSQGMRQVLDELTDAFDIVIFDAPPLLPVTDAATLAAICDGVMLVARYGKTRQEHILRATEQLSSINARIVGTVLNFVPAKSSRYDGYGYGYGYETKSEAKAPVTA